MARPSSIEDELNSLKYVYLRSLSEPNDNRLEIIIDEAFLSEKDIADSKESVTQFASIRSGNGKAYRLNWGYYVAYLVTNEMAGSCGKYDDEVFTGSILRLYTKSNFLQHLAQDTGGYQEPILHYKLVCLNHIIDIGAHEAPEVHIL